MPALELGWGDGDPPLELRRRGLEVEGVDSSADILDRRRRADEQGIRATVFHQRMEALKLPRRYRAIFLAGPTFTPLPDDDAAPAALRGIRAHLAEGAPPWCRPNRSAASARLPHPTAPRRRRGAG